MSARILVVEDEEALTTLLRYNLDAEGYDVETVGRGDDADTRLKEHVPDLIVLDWMLPGLSGIISGPPLMVSMVTSSPLAMVRTGFSLASKKPQWQVSGLECR